jgi:signal transduction histidine kinase
VFDLFSQVGAHATRADGGLGIGLSLVRSLVELHGGSVEAHSEGVGRGSTFTVRLPLELQ